jgi:hypothetical protein
MAREILNAINNLLSLICVNLRLPCLPYETFHLFHRGEIMFFIFNWGNPCPVESESYSSGVRNYMPLKAKINVSIKIATSSHQSKHRSDPACAAKANNCCLNCPHFLFDLN